MTVEEYLAGFAGFLVHELEPIVRMKAVTENTDLLGAYTEAAARRLIRRMVHPMHISTGAVVDYPMPTRLKQLDVIVWAPFPAPGMLEVDDFALVPRSSAFGIIEIKRSNYSGVDAELEEFVAAAPEMVASNGGASRDDSQQAAIGVIGVIENKPSARLETLIRNKKVVAIFDKHPETGEVLVRATDVLSLVNFLHYVSWRYRVQSSGPGYPQLVTT